MKNLSGYVLTRRYPRALRQQLLQELNRLVTYEPVTGIMGKTVVGKSSLCNALFRSQLCAVKACIRGRYHMARLVEAMITCLPKQARSPLIPHLHSSLADPITINLTVSDDE